MCGFVGYWGGALSGQSARSALEKMSDAIAHRGPDDSGVWLDDQARLGLAHRRLAVVDLSAAGHQPMVSTSGRFVLVFNGEIYNHQALRRELTQHGRRDWRGHSDTETLLAGCEEWGVERTLAKSVGMFGFALWNVRDRVLTLGRDRIGEKPLYFGWQGRETGGKAFIFGSELKALVRHPAFAGRVCEHAVADFVRFGNVSGYRSIYRGIEKLPPGSILTLDTNSATVSVERYWNLDDRVREQRQAVFKGTESEALARLESMISTSVREQVLADVPVGAFLSGGVDSALVVALMCRESGKRVKTFSVGFENEAYDEAPFARAVAEHLGTDHTEIYVSARTAIDLVPHLVEIFDEPFADSSQIPTYYVSELARKSVTVALSGDAGDELFGGYNRYLFTSALWSRIAKIPVPLRRLAGAVLGTVAPIASDRHNALIPRGLRVAGLAERLQKSAFVLSARSLKELYMGLLAISPDADRMLLVESDDESLMAPELERIAGLSDAESMMVWDMKRFLPDDILVKVDRAAMAVSLETRIPLLDHRLIDFAWSLPEDSKIRKTEAGYVTKWALRQILYKHIPRELIERPKKGFAVPIGDWIRGPLRGWAEDLLSKPKLQDSGVFEHRFIRKMFQEHLDGKRNWQHKLWAVLILQDWLHRTRNHIADA